LSTVTAHCLLSPCCNQCGGWICLVFVFRQAIPCTLAHIGRTDDTTYAPCTYRMHKKKKVQDKSVSTVYTRETHARMPRPRGWTRKWSQGRSPPKFMFTVVGDVWPAAKKALRARGNEEERSSKSITDGLDLRSGLGEPKNQELGTRFQRGGGGGSSCKHRELQEAEQGTGFGGLRR
jgi:hypothetical protein